MTARRFPAPWIVEEYRGISYIVRDANKFPVAYVYFESEPGRRAPWPVVLLPGLDFFPTASAYPTPNPRKRLFCSSTAASGDVALAHNDPP